MPTFGNLLRFKRFHNCIFKTSTIVLAFLACLSVVSLFSLNMYWQVQPDPLTLTVTKDGQDLHRGVLSPGETVRFTRLACVDHKIHVKVHREIINIDNNSKTMMPTLSYSATPSDECFKTSFYLIVPFGLEPGEYYYNPLLNYEVNPGKTISKAAPGIYFTIAQ